MDSKRDNHLHDTPCGEPASQCLARRLGSAIALVGLDTRGRSMGLVAAERVSMDCVCPQSPEVEKDASALNTYERTLALIIRYREEQNMRFSDIVLELEAEHGIVITANTAIGRYHRYCNRVGKAPHDTGYAESRRSRTETSA